MEEAKIENVKEKIKAIAKKGEKYLDAISLIINYEKKHANDKFFQGWKMEDIEGLNGGMIAQMKEAGIITESPYHSNKHSYWILADDWYLYEIALTRLFEEYENREHEVSIEPVDVSKYKENFEELVKQHDMLDYWAKFINPKVTGLEHVKKAILLSIASTNDRHGDRGRIHVLLHGDPGTAKTELMMWLHHFLGAKFTTHRSSDAGLMGGAIGNELVMGALPRADGHVICIDELDKFQKKDYAGLLEAMSDGRVTITLMKGEAEKTFKARVRVIAGCNKLDRFPPELLDRFDFKIHLTSPDKDDEKKIMEERIDTWFMEKPSYDGKELRAFLKWISDFEPKIPDETRKIAKKLMKIYIDMKEEEKGNIRRDESILRVAYTIAKLNRRNVTPYDFLRAIELIDEKHGSKLRKLIKEAGINLGGQA